MTAADFETAIAQLGISRAELCRRLGLALNTGTAYAKGRSAIPPYIALAIAALVAGVPAYGSIRRHGYDARSYKEAFGLPRTISMWPPATKARQR